ncbi:MAG: hypothetical protein WD226_06395 [Planctomycetota bacterium]
MRHLLLLLPAALFVVADLARAQIVIVHFDDEKKAKRYKKDTIETVDGPVLIGEPVEGGGITVQGNSLGYRHVKEGQGTGRENTSNEIYLLNVDDPSDVPYEVEDGEKKLVRKKAKLVFNGNDASRLSFFSRTEDLHSLGVEHRYRLGRMEALERERDDQKRASAEWFEAHRLFMLESRRLESWLREVGFMGAADDLAKDLARADKASRGDALRERKELALESVAVAPNPEELDAATKKIAPDIEMATVESMHFRMHYPVGQRTEAAMLAITRFAEEVLDGFRNEFVDPYVGEDFKDTVPLGVQLVEFFFCPEEHYERFYIDYYGGTWRDERSLATGGTSLVRRFEPRMLRYIKLKETTDLESTITSHLGSTLARLHFNGGYGANTQPWIGEGLSYYLSFEYCGRNTWTTVDWSETEYAKGARKEGEKTIELGLRAMFNDRALVDGSRFDKLTLMTVAEMTDADFAKSWSMFDFVAKRLGKNGQRWLRAACIHSKNRAKFLADWRADSEALFDVTGEDVFKVLEDRWRAYASGEQDISEDGRR